MTAYAEFRLRIDRGLSAGTYRVVATGPAGEGLGRFKLPFSDLELENFVLRVGRTRRGRRRVESPEMELAKDFGGRLFLALFDADVRELYRSSFADARSENRGLRITLALTGAPELSRVPWEYLYDHPSFLSISTWTPIVRYLDLAKPRRPLQIALPLRILAVVSAPANAEPIDVASEKAKLGQALAPLVQSGAVSIDWLETATLRALQRQLRRGAYHVLHYIGHGGYDPQADDGVVLFEDESGRARTVTGVQLGTILQDEVSLRIAVLNACEGGRSSLDDPFSGVATSLIEREIPAVIGMQFEITDRAAIVFASEFYSALADGFPVDSAMAEARKAIYADENDVEWATPVLFMRVQDGLLFEVPAHAPARDQRPDPNVAVEAAKAEALAAKAGIDPTAAAAVAQSAGLAAHPEALEGSPLLAVAIPAAGPSSVVEAESPAGAGRQAEETNPATEMAGDPEADRKRPAAEAERERLRLELDAAREREREAIEERDRLAAEAQAFRTADERRVREAEEASRQAQTSAEARRLEQAQRQKAAAADAAEAARLEKQRQLMADDVERLKVERRRLEAELRSKRDASAGRVDSATTNGEASEGASGSARPSGGTGASRTTGDPSAAGRSTPVASRRPTPRRTGPRAWLATRQAPNRAAAVGRGFLAGGILVGGYGLGYIIATDQAPDEPAQIAPLVEKYGGTLLITGLSLIVILVIAGLLIELLVPPLRAPAREVTRWPIVLLLGLTLGPAAFLAVFPSSDVLGQPDLVFVFGGSLLAFVLAEAWMGRGARSSS